jgi:hypothetical protein
MKPHVLVHLAHANTAVCSVAQLSDQFLCCCVLAVLLCVRMQLIASLLI